MKKILLAVALMLSLSRAATAADPAVPMMDIEPRPANAPAGSFPAGVAPDDVTAGAQVAPSPHGARVMGELEDEFLGARQLAPVLEGF